MEVNLVILGGSGQGKSYTAHITSYTIRRDGLKTISNKQHHCLIMFKYTIFHQTSYHNHF